MSLSNLTITKQLYHTLVSKPNIKQNSCYLLQFDGGTQPNPGEASGGAIIYSPTKKMLYETGEYIDFATNNIAEYKGLIIGLKLALEKGFTNILVEGDSQLIISQVIGKYKVKNDKLKIYHKEVVDLVSKFDYVAIRHIYRDFNKEADRITNETIFNKKSYVLEY